MERRDARCDLMSRFQSLGLKEHYYDTGCDQRGADSGYT
jgi:hypothetical protein